MTSTVFTPYVTPVPSTWLNDVNGHTYSSTPISPATTVHPSGVIQYTPAGTNAVATVIQTKFAESVSLLDFINKSDVGTTNDIAYAIMSAFTYCQSSAKALHIPAGTYYCSGATNTVSPGSQGAVDIFGDGCNKTILRKFGVTPSPILTFTCTSANLLGQYHKVSDLTFIGNNGGSVHAGLTFNLWAFVQCSNIEFKQCASGVTGNGLLSAEFISCRSHNNTAFGYSFLWDGVNTYANAIKFFGGSASYNSSLGINFDYGNGLHLYGMNIEGNGTTQQLTTGGISIGAHLSTELGMGQVTIDGCWLEGNLGQSLQMASGNTFSNVAIRNSIVVIGESVGGIGYAVSIPSATQVTIESNIIVGLNLAAVTVAASYFICKNSTISVLNNTSIVSEVVGVKTYLGDINYSAIGGFKDASNGAAGFVGEYLSAAVLSSAPVALSTGVWKTVTSISLSPGDWDVSSTVGLVCAGTTTLSAFGSSISSATNNPGVESSQTITPYSGVVPLVLTPTQTNPTVRYNVSVNTNVYLTTFSTFGAAACSAFGTISARRVR